MSGSSPLVLIDGSSYLYRAFHALPNLTNREGQPTGAIYGVLNMVRRLLKDYSPTHIAIVFDAKGKNFRHALYEDYKANRPPMPDELRQQVDRLYEVIQAMGLPLLVVPDVEADDVIGTLATQASEQGQPVLISTGDKDMAQLVNDHIALIDTMQNKISTPQDVEEKFGVTPERIVDYLSLVGDTSDNIPGVPKCGPKTAAKWLQEYGSLDALIQSADEIKGKIGENLRASLGQLPISHTLATIKRDVELEQRPEDLAPTSQDTEKLIELFKTLGFTSWLNDIQGATKTQPSTDIPTKKTIQARYEALLDESSFQRWLEKLQQSELFAFDTETTSLNYMNARIVGLSFAVTAHEAAYLPLAHDYLGAPAQLDATHVFTQLRTLLEDPEKKKLGQNLKYDRNVLLNHGIDLQGIEHDTMLESYIYDSTATRHDMDSLAKKYLDYETTHFEDIAGKGKKQLTFNQIDIETATHYAAEDADITFRLHQALWPKLQQTPSLAKLYSEIDLPLVPVLSRIERNGVTIDTQKLHTQSKEIAQTLTQLEEQAYAEAGKTFNLNSTKQIQDIFFTEKNFPIVRKTPKGQPSTAEDVLETLAHEHDLVLPRILLKHRGLSKLKSTYIDKLPEQVNVTTGRVHTSYHQAVASTGRLSSSDPNLQNIPVRTEEGRRIRQAFVTPKGYQLLAADYSQIELRIMAHLSEDDGLLTAFKQGLDIHSATAAEVFEVDEETVSSEQRRAAKAINFGLIYGMSAFGLAKQLEVPRNQAQEYIDLYFTRYPGVKNYMEKTRLVAKEKGYVETLFGRRLYLPEINARNAQRRQYAERTAINAPMQGTAADIIKRAMLHLDSWLQTHQADARIIMQVHDELVLEVSKDQIETVSNHTRNIMNAAAELLVPLVVDIGIGDNWEAAH
ncbi:MAG: DNA polymerase I [Gammaproteobacteria bacterium]|nr:DNA polymerase I [Gammaproteobacteria bacterium]